ncbi:hypothetical protein ACJMK2_011346 [Sinanodonta woodiana]|uniref:Uncharacterized protein n=1 Tax=Sinanodonta woodiana TaxID=1069815 RepID=A0ABD3V4N3_SINWO
MISITSTNPEFSVNFPSPVSVSEIALAKLRIYHSWPNIRSSAFEIHDNWSKRKQQSNILTYNNDPNGGGRHIAPNNVNISSVIALNLVCDVIEGSYQINQSKQSNQAQQGYILYSFAPTAPPGFLIVEDPVNPVYMRCHTKLLTRINIRLTDQSNNLIDLRGEVLAISLFVKS